MRINPYKIGEKYKNRMKKKVKCYFLTLLSTKNC